MLYIVGLVRMTATVVPAVKKTDVVKPKESKLAEKYKYVRFVEKKKVLRKMRALQQSLMNGKELEPEQRSSMEVQLSELRKDLMYVDKFPSNQKYISLFPSEGSLSEICLKKQREIRSMIVNLTARTEAGDTRKIDVIKSDDFFASADGLVKENLIVEPVAPKKVVAPVRAATGEYVHPSWEAKKTNDKLTGSIANLKFEGQRVVFDEND